MAARQILVPGAMPSRNANGRALPAVLRFYTPGAAFSTPKAVYTDEALSVAHPFPLPSDSGGRFPQIWAEGEEYFDVTWSRLDNGAFIDGFTDIRPLADALLASAALSQIASDAAESHADAAEASSDAASGFSDSASAAADTAADEAGNASSSADRAEAAAQNAEAIVGGDLTSYQLRSEKGFAEGYAPLDADNQVPSAHLMSAPVSTAQAAAIAAAIAEDEANEDIAVAFAIAL